MKILKKTRNLNILWLAIVLTLISAVAACTSTSTPLPAPSASKTAIGTPTITATMAPSATASPIQSLIPGATPSPSASPYPSTSISSSEYTINLSESPTFETYLTDSKGITLYRNSNDSPGVSNVPDSQSTTWPIFYAPSIIVPAPLKAADFGAVTRSDGKKQTTYHGYPLYYYSGDQSPGDINGEGLGGIWYYVVP